MAKSTENKALDEDMYGGYSENTFELINDIRKYTKLISVMVKLELVSIRAGQILCSNYGQKRFNQLRDRGF